MGGEYHTHNIDRSREKKKENTNPVETKNDKAEFRKKHGNNYISMNMKQEQHET